MRYTVNAYINHDNLIEMTETWVEDQFMGDLHVSAKYSDYEEMDGVMVPATVEIWQGGGAVFGVAIREADANPTNLIALITPPAVAGNGRPGGPPGGGAAPTPAELIEEVAPGVYHIDTNYKSLAVEFEDGFVVFESAGFPANVNAGIIMEAVASISEKPITAVINSHPHSDHTTSLVPIVRAGIPLIVSANSVDFQRMALSSPRTLLGEDTLSPEFQTVPDGEVMVIEDSMNRLEIHHIPSLHTDSLLFVYLPNHRLAMQADFTIRGDGNGGTLPYEGQTPLGQQFAEYIRDNGLEFDNMLGVHPSGYVQSTEDVFMALPPAEDM
jgi:glyoxylase-like metal-dependent hydrolase (beta-lactamase superfamily II)